MSPIRVTMVEFTPSGGLFQFAFQMGRALAETGRCEVRLLTGPDPELTSDVPGFRVLGVLPTWHPGARTQESVLLRRSRRVVRFGQHLQAWRRVARLLCDDPPDVVQWGALRYWLDGWFVRRIAGRLGGTVMSVVVHSPRHRPVPAGEVPRPAGPLLRQTIGAALARMDVSFVLGQQSAAELREAWPQVGRVDLLPHGDESVFLNEGEPAGVPASPARVLFFGTLAAHKGVDVLLDAFALLRERLPDLRLVVAGGLGDGVDPGELQRRAGAIGRVALRIGYVPLAEVRTLFEAATVVVAPYRHANQSGVVHLAHTFARPVVATRVGDLPDVVVDGETGALVDVDDAAALAAAVERLVRDPATADRLGRAGRQRLLERAGWPDIAATVAGVYADLVAARRRGTAAGDRPPAGLPGSGPLA